VLRGQTDQAFLDPAGGGSTRWRAGLSGDSNDLDWIMSQNALSSSADIRHTTDTAAADAPAVLWLWPALLTYPLTLALLFLNRSWYNFVITKEGGLDSLTPVVLLISFAFGVQALRRTQFLPASAMWIRYWITMVLLGIVFLAGEELSWGQHLGFWSAEDLPQWIRQANDQQETNIHNLARGGNSLEQLFKNLVYLGTLIGCIILPGRRRWKKQVLSPSQAGYWFWPTKACLPAAIGVLLIMFPNRIAAWLTGEKLDVLRHSELHELYIALMLMAYLASLAWRLRACPRAALRPPVQPAAHDAD
jgi:hypothetical protein